jgi:hypothetical protein
MKSCRFVSSFSIIVLTLLSARVSPQPLPAPVKFLSTVPYDSGDIGDPLGVDKRCGTQTTLSSSGSPSLITDDVTFTAQAIANDVCRRGEQITCDDGGVAFYDGTTLIGNIALKNCLAVFDTASLTVGRHLITARFNPPSGWHRSYARVSQIVEKQHTSTTLTSSPNPSLHAQEVVFTATVLSPLGVASGKVRFSVAGNPITIVPVDSDGIATLAKKNLPVGTNAITAEYLGDPDNGPSTSAPLNQVVNPD